MKTLKFSFFVITGSIIGWAAWCSGVQWFLPLSLFAPALWFHSPNRLTAFAVFLTYQLAAGSGLVRGVMQYYHTGVLLGVGLWLGAALVCAVPWGIAWRPRPRPRRLWAIVPYVLTTIPPLAVAAWYHPITSAGALFPGWCLFGIVGIAALQFALFFVPLRFAPFAAIAILFWSFALSGPPPAPPPGWIGVRTAVASHGDPGEAPDADFTRNMSLTALATAQRADVVLTPEFSVGMFSVPAQHHWQKVSKEHAGTAYLLGAQIELETGKTANTLILSKDGVLSAFYRQRMPVPISMWKPWTKSDGTIAYWFYNPTVQLEGRRVAVFICYEQSLVWPFIQSLALRPDVMMAASNERWCAGTSIPTVRKLCVDSWSRLFAVPLLEAENL